METNYIVDIILIRTNQTCSVEIDPSTSFKDLYETV